MLFRIVKFIKRILRKPMNILYKIIPDKIYIKYMFLRKQGRTLNLKSPQTFNEKLQWLKLYDRNPIYTTLVDKYEVREYISNEIGKEHLIPLIGLYDSFDNINFSKLPNQFVLKCTHDSGGVVICKDIDTFNYKEARKKIEASLKKNYYYNWREWPYKNINPRIICEKYMIDDSNDELIDYKFMCFNGKVKYIFVCTNRNSKGDVNIDIYDSSWNLTPYSRKKHPNSGFEINKPSTFDQMVKYAEKLSNGFPFIRVDYYEIKEKLYFGELTFYPESGFGKFAPEDFDYILGNHLKLPTNRYK